MAAKTTILHLIMTKLGVLSANGQTNIPVNFQADRLKNNFHIFLAVMIIGTFPALTFFSNNFQFDSVSKVENIITWNFSHLLMIDWIFSMQIFSIVSTKLLEILHFKSRNVFFWPPDISPELRNRFKQF